MVFWKAALKAKQMVNVQLYTGGLVLLNRCQISLLPSDNAKLYTFIYKNSAKYILYVLFMVNMTSHMFQIL